MSDETRRVGVSRAGPGFCTTTLMRWSGRVRPDTHPARHSFEPARGNGFGDRSFTMKAVTWQGKRDVRVDEGPDPTIQEPTMPS